MLLSTILPEVARLHPTNIAMKYQGQVLTYGELLSHVSSVASGFIHLSIQPGERIALIGNPSPYLAMAECAAVAIGAIPVTIFPDLAPIEVIQILQDAAPSL
ncbi:Surfactin synthase subunit 1 [compost metagenome]